MRPLKQILLAAVCVAATTALAHDGVQNPAVKARMDAMGVIGQNMKVLAGMAKGETAFDATAANNALLTIAEQAGEVPALFEAEEDDPKSEAAPEIWLMWDDFTAKAVALQNAAREGATVADAAELGAAIGTVGAACKVCHTAYKF